MEVHCEGVSGASAEAKSPATKKTSIGKVVPHAGRSRPSGVPDDHMDSIEPYNYKELQQFSTAYLPGFLADRFDVPVEQCRERADKRCEGTFAAALRRTVKHYDTCTVKELNVNLKRGKVHYALMPVWMLNTKWKGKDFLFAMNGQTGKLVGDLPVSWGKFWGLFAAIAIPLSALSSALALLFM